MTIAHDALDLTVQGPLCTCSNLFNLELTVQGPSPPHPCTGTPCMVDILLECFLVCINNRQFQITNASTLECLKI